MDITQKQLNILSGEDTESICFWSVLTRSAIVLLPSEIRRRFAEEWDGMEEVNDMIEEAEREEREEREENDTREPQTDEEEEEREDEEEEEDDGTDTSPEARELCDPTDYEELKAYLKTLIEEAEAVGAGEYRRRG
eukprot:symbB.v1.2.026062.t1/scaffold2477.1/size83577/5